MKKIFICLFLLVFLPFPAISKELVDLDNKNLQAMLEENRGKVVLLNFFATWCPPCRMEIPELVKLRMEYPESSLLLIGLAVDEDKTPVLPFIKKLGVNYPVYAAKRDITDRYGVTSVPHNTFIAKDGRIIISEPGIADINILTQVVDDLATVKK